MLKKLLSASIAACVVLTLTLALSTRMATAHEHRMVNEYMFVVGFIQEPAFEGLLNAVSVRITKMPEDQSGMQMGGGSKQNENEDKAVGMSMSMGGHTGMPVEGLESTLTVEVTHAPSGMMRQMPLQLVLNDAGHYTAYFIPTATGQYIFRFTGSIEGMQIDETFESGPGRFADIEPATPIQFPEVAASGRELEAAVRGALESAQQAQDTARVVEATANNARDGADGAATLATMGIVVGAIGIVVGGAGLVAAFRRRN